jgi:hypothetical protein
VKQATLRLSQQDLELIQEGLQLLIDRETGQRGDRWYGWLLNVALRIAHANNQTGGWVPLDLATAAWPSKILPKAFTALDQVDGLRQRIKELETDLKAATKKPAPAKKPKPKPQFRKPATPKPQAAASAAASPFPHNIPPQPPVTA